MAGLVTCSRPATTMPSPGFCAGSMTRPESAEVLVKLPGSRPFDGFRSPAGSTSILICTGWFRDFGLRRSRMKLQENAISALTHQLEKDGIVLLSDLLSSEQLRNMQRAFASRLERLRWND